MAELKRQATNNLQSLDKRWDIFVFFFSHCFGGVVYLVYSNVLISRPTMPTSCGADKKKVKEGEDGSL